MIKFFRNVPQPNLLSLPSATTAVLLMCFFGCVLQSTDLLAQASTPEQSAVLEEVVVTAQKREENLQDVPIAMTAITEGTFEKYGLENIMDMHGVIPNMIFEKTPGNNTTYKLFIRGIGTSNSVFSLDPAVGIYIDGVLLTRSMGALIDLVDVERIEVLRGPQSTLYGRNNSSGAIRLITKKAPLDQSEFGFEGIIGNYDRNQVRLTAGAPLIEDKVGLKIAVQSNQRDGFQTNLYLNKEADTADSDQVWVSLRVMVSDRTEFNLRGDWTHDDSLPHMPASFVHNPDNDLSTFESQADPNPNYMDTWGVSGTFDISLDNYSITSITGYREMDMEEVTDVDGTILPSFESYSGQTHSQFSQEVYASGDFGDKSQWVIGGFYLYEDLENRQRFDVLAHILGYPSTQFFQQDVDSVAAYGQIQVNVTDALRLTGGLRFTTETKNFSVQGYNPLPGLPDPDFNSLKFDFADKLKEDVLNWRLAADYRLSANTMIYTSATTGFRSGGFNGNASSLAATEGFGREDVLSIETGLKMDLLENRLRFNLGAFWYDFQNIQQALLDVNQYNTVTSDATITGIELEASFIPFEGLQLDWTASTLTNDIKNSDAELQHMPDFQTRFAGSYMHPSTLLGLEGNIIFSASARYSDTYFTSVANTPSRLSGEYTIVDATLAFETSDRHWRLSLVGLNLTDEQYNTQVFDVSNFANVAYINEPRRWFVKLKYSY